MIDINHTEVSMQCSWLQCYICADSGLANMLCWNVVPSAVLYTSPLPVIPAPLSNIGILVPCTSNTDFKFKLVTRINMSKSMRRQRAGISNELGILIGGCWKMVTSSPVPPEQGPGLCVGQRGFLFRLCHHAAHDMLATALLQHCKLSLTHLLSPEPRSLLCLPSWVGY